MNCPWLAFLICPGSLCLVALIIACVISVIYWWYPIVQYLDNLHSISEASMNVWKYLGIRHAGTDIYLCGDPKRCPVCLGPGIRYPVNISRDTGPGVTWPVYVPTLHTIHCPPVLCIHCVLSALLKLQKLSTNCPNTWNTRNCRNGHVQ